MSGARSRQAALALYRNEAQHDGIIRRPGARMRVINAALLLLVVLLPPQQAAASPRAEAGVLDLRDWRFEDRGAVALAGEWVTVEDRLLPPDTVPEPEAGPYRTLPYRWIGEHRTGTYRLRVLLPEGQDRAGILVRKLGTSYRLYSNDDLIVETGVVSGDPGGGEPSFALASTVIDVPADGVVELVLQVSDHHYDRGGPWEALWMGSDDGIRAFQRRNTQRTFFIGGILLSVAVYHLILFLTRPAERAPLFFSITCTGIALRLLCVEEVYLADLLPTLPWAWLVRIEYLSILFAAAAVLPFLEELFPRARIRRLSLPLLGLTSLAAVAIVVQSPAQFSGWINEFQALIAAICATTILICLRALRHGSEGAALLSFAAGLMLIAGLHDVVLTFTRRSLIALPGSAINLVPYGFLVVVALQATVLARRAARIRRTLDRRTGELRRVKRDLDAYIRRLEHGFQERGGRLEQTNLELRAAQQRLREQEHDSDSVEGLSLRKDHGS